MVTVCNFTPCGRGHTPSAPVPNIKGGFRRRPSCPPGRQEGVVLWTILHVVMHAHAWTQRSCIAIGAIRVHKNPTSTQTQQCRGRLTSETNEKKSRHGDTAIRENMFVVETAPSNQQTIIRSQLYSEKRLSWHRRPTERFAFKRYCTYNRINHVRLWMTGWFPQPVLSCLE